MHALFIGFFGTIQFIRTIFILGVRNATQSSFVHVNKFNERIIGRDKVGVFKIFENDNALLYGLVTCFFRSSMT